MSVTAFNRARRAREADATVLGVNETPVLDVISLDEQLAKMTNKDLENMCLGLGIDTSGMRKKAEFIEAIKAENLAGQKVDDE